MTSKGLKGTQGDGSVDGEKMGEGFQHRLCFFFFFFCNFSYAGLLRSTSCCQLQESAFHDDASEETLVQALPATQLSVSGRQRTADSSLQLSISGRQVTQLKVDSLLQDVAVSISCKLKMHILLVSIIVWKPCSNPWSHLASVFVPGLAFSITDSQVLTK